MSDVTVLRRASAECGIRNAECQCECRSANDLPFQFRIPHPAFHIVFQRFANAKLRVSSSSAMFTDFTTTSAGTVSCAGADQPGREGPRHPRMARVLGGSPGTE